MTISSTQRKSLYDDSLSRRRKNRCKKATYHVGVTKLLLVVVALSIVSSSVVHSFCGSNSLGLTQQQHRKAPNHRRDPITEGFCPTRAPTTRICGSTSNYHLKELDGVDQLAPGSIVLSRVETSLGCHDLRQPYMHKAVILVLDHDPDDFTQGVLLNRASDLVLNDRDIVYVDDEDDEEVKPPPKGFRNVGNEDEKPKADQVIEGINDMLLSSSSSWKIHFGGDIGSWYEEDAQLLMLHGMDNEKVRGVSDPVVDAIGNAGGIFITSHMGAQSLIATGDAKAEDFYSFSGFCGWERGQLKREVDRGSWCLASFVESDGGDENADKAEQSPHPVLSLLQKHSWKNSDYNPQSGGLAFWHELMASLGKDSVEREPPKIEAQPFSDLMLKEWSTQRLLVNGGSSSNEETDPNAASDKNDDEWNIDDTENGSSSSSFGQIEDADIFRALRAASDPTPLVAGSILRASSGSPSPYLLAGHLFHKSIILLLQEGEEDLDEDEDSIGVILNLPTKNKYGLMVDGQMYEFPIRYGGPSSSALNDDDEVAEDPYFWFHDHQAMKHMGIGIPLSKNYPSGIHVCNDEDVQEALSRELARKEDFLLVRGFCAWEKFSDPSGYTSTGGVAGQLRNGNLEHTRLVTPGDRKALWKTLRKQKRLASEDDIRGNQALLEQAWEQAGGNPESDARTVFDSNVDVSKLADDALFVWMKLFLLGNGVYYPEDF